MRSFLFVPGDSPRKFENAKKTAADALILDLEDSIAPDEKVGARRTVREMLDARNPSQKIYIRINALDTGSRCRNQAEIARQHERRMEAAVGAVARGAKRRGEVFGTPHHAPQPRAHVFEIEIGRASCRERV